jgi:glutaredoxin
MRWLLVLSLVLLSLPTSAEIYKWVDSDGVVHYSSRASQTEKSEDVTSRVKTRGNFVSEPSPPPDAADKKADSKNGAVADSKSVTVFTNPGCKECKQVKAFLNARGISYKEYDIASDAEGKKRYADLGGNSVPFVTVGDQRMNGFNQDQLEKMLKTAGIL